MPDDDALELDDAGAEEPEERRSRRGRSGRDADPELREKMRTLDPLERKWGLAAGGLMIVVSLVILTAVLNGTSQTLTIAPVAHLCHSPYVQKGGQCVWKDVRPGSDFVWPFAISLVLGLGSLAAAWFSRRVPTIFMNFLSGLALNATTFVPFLGFLLIGYGGWLIVRSWRLQRYGVADAKSVRTASIQRAEAKRDARKARKAGGPATATTAGRSEPTPSKRYTPKSKPRRK